MLHQMQKTVCALAICAITTGSVLANNIDVKVIGTISPGACDPTISGRATIDYGQINAETLKKDTFTVLAEKTLNFAIACDAPAKVAIIAKSGRGASAVNTDNTLAETAVNNDLFGTTATGTFGLGLAGTKGIGGYGIRIKAGSVTADGNAVDSIQSHNSLSAWAKTGYGTLIGPTSLRYSSWATSGTTLPVAFTTLAGKLGVQAYINKASELDLTKEITLDGLTTIELVYL